MFNGSGKAIDKGPPVLAEDFLDIMGNFYVCSNTLLLLFIVVLMYDLPGFLLREIYLTLLMLDLCKLPSGWSIHLLWR